MTNLADISDADLLASLPRGIRNNNPLNLKTKGSSGQDGPFAVYGSMDEGLAAADRTLQSYKSRGINTVAGVVSRWAPPSENDTARYISHVAKRTGLDPNAPIDLSNPQIRQALLGAMGEYETGAPVAKPDLAQVSDDELLASLKGQAPPQAAPGLPAPPVAAPPAKVGPAAPARRDQVLGFEKGLLKPLDNAAVWLEAGAKKLGLDTDAINQAVGLPSAQQAADSRKAFLAERAKAGVLPGRVGEFAGNVAGTAWIPGGPLAQGVAGGALLSDDPTNVKGVLKDAAVGGVTGRLAAGASDAIQIAARKALSKAANVMTLPELEAAKKAAYKAVDASGFTFGKSDIAALASDFKNTVASSALSKTAKDEAQSIIDYTRKLADGGPVTLAQLEKLHGDIYTALVKKGGDTGVVGSQFRQKINGLIDATGDTTVKAARDLNARFKKADVLLRKSRTADIQAEKDYGGDYGRKLKNRLFPLINPDQQAANLRGATPDELAAITQMVTGTKVQNAASMVGGMLDPRRLGGKIVAGITGAGGGAAALPTGGMSLIAPAAQMAAGFGLTGAASGIARKNLNNAVKLIAAGGSKANLAPVPTKASQATEEAIANYLRPLLVSAAAPAVATARTSPKTKPKK